MSENGKNFKPTVPTFVTNIYNLLVENFPHTYLVGGWVRDFLLGKKNSDIDICTTAYPDMVKNLLENNQIDIVAENNPFGIIHLKHSNFSIDISTLRQEKYTRTRYPQITFTHQLKQDSQRRDFTVNALYLNIKTGKITDYHRGMADLHNKVLRLIGNPETKFKEDPLRMVRALRFCLNLNFQLARTTKQSIVNNFHFLNRLNKKLIVKELDKLKSVKQKNLLKKILSDPKMLDNYF